MVMAFFITAAFSTMAVCAEKAPSDVKAAKPSKVNKPKKDYTKDDYIEHIKGNLDRMPEIMNYIPGLSKGKDAAGNMVYMYHGKKLADLDKEKVIKIYSMVSNNAVRIRTARTNAQLESIRRANQLSNMTHQVTVPPTSPRVSSVTQPPKVPTPPPATPRR